MCRVHTTNYYIGLPIKQFHLWKNFIVVRNIEWCWLLSIWVYQFTPLTSPLFKLCKQVSVIVIPEDLKKLPRAVRLAHLGRQKVSREEHVKRTENWTSINKTTKKSPPQPSTPSKSTPKKGSSKQPNPLVRQKVSREDHFKRTEMIKALLTKKLRKSPSQPSTSSK